MFFLLLFSELFYNHRMLSIPPGLKIEIEVLELVIILVYLLAGITKKKHLTYLLFVCGAEALMYDIFVLRGHHAFLMWGALNTPLLIGIAWLIYVKILRKSARRVAIRVAALCTMLFRG